MLPAATACSSGFHRCVRPFSTSVMRASPRLPSVLPSRVASSSPAAPPPTTTMSGTALIAPPLASADDTLAGPGCKATGPPARG